MYPLVRTGGTGGALFHHCRFVVGCVNFIVIDNTVSRASLTVVGGISLLLVGDPLQRQGDSHLTSDSGGMV